MAMSSHEKIARYEDLVSRGYSECAVKNILWIEENCVIPDGKLMGKPLVIADFMCEDFNLIYRDADDLRGPVSKAIISRPRKNAKTVEAALIVLLGLLGPEAKQGTEAYSGAMAREQAAVLFKLLSRLIRRSPTNLAQYCIIRDSAKEIEVPELQSKYKAMSKDGKTAHGLSPRIVVFDEMGQEKKESNELIEALISGSAAQEDPLIVTISTQAPTDTAWLSKEIDDAVAGHDDSVVCRLDTLPMEHANPFSAEALSLCNPAWDEWMNQPYLLKQAADAARMSSKQAAFRNLNLNQRVDQNEPFIERAIWLGVGDDPRPLEDCDKIFAGLDLSEVRDLTAFVAVGVDDEGWNNVHSTFWLPYEGLEEKEVKDNVPYRRLEEEGTLSTTPGAAIDYDYVAEFIYEFVQCHGDRIGKIAFDRFNWRHFRPALVRAGFSESQLEGEESVFVEFGQGFISMSPAVRALETLILSKKFRHGNNYLLNMCMGNTRLMKDPSGNRKPAKHKSNGRIDGMVSLTMAAGVAGEYDGEATSNKGTPRIRLA